jgi:hypothetical protein
MPRYNTVEDYELADDYLELDVPAPLPTRHYVGKTAKPLYPTAPKTTVRVCKCGTHLSRYNKKPYCGACAVEARTK